MANNTQKQKRKKLTIRKIADAFRISLDELVGR